MPDGSLGFLGRKDDQVKILGHRIELGEIENALLRHESIESVVVLAKEVNSSEKLLVAYMISEINLDPSDLRKFLKEIVPVYMLSLIHISEPTRQDTRSRMPSSA